jgi:hypothetical protein
MTITKVNDLSEVTGDHLGCWIDGGHINATAFDIQLVETAIHFGWDINIEDWKELKNQVGETEEAVEDIFGVAEIAYHWFNELLPQGYYFHIEDNSLFLNHEDMELIDD